MSRIDRIRLTVSTRNAARAAEARADAAREAGPANLPVPVGPATTARSFRDERRRGESEVDAQLMGQDGQRRGLRAGPSIHETARNAYARTEWSGSYDRRMGAGRLAKKSV